MQAITKMRTVGPKGGESNIIEVYIRYLRQKLESEGEDRLLHTVRGVGYVLREPD